MAPPDDASDPRWDRAAAWAFAAAVAALCALAAWRRWRFLDGSPYPMGVDGYYYAVQLRSLLAHGHLVWPASPLAFWLMAPLAAAAGPIAGAKLGAALGGALAGVPAYLLGRRVGGGRAAGLVACTVVTTSAGSFYLSVEFVKQGLGVTVALAALVVVLRALERPTRWRLAAAVAGLAAAALTHKVAAGLVVVAAAPAALVELRARGALDRRRLLVAGGVVVGLAALAVALGALWPARFVALRDLALAGGLLGGPARWSAPALDLGHGHVLAMGHEAVLAAAAAAALAGAWAVLVLLRRAAARPGRPAERAAVVALAVLGLAIALPTLDVGDPQGLAFRLRLIAFVPFALVAAAALGAAIRAVPWRSFDRTAVVVALAAGWLAVQPATRDAGVIRTHPAMVAAVRALDGVIPAGGVAVTTERHIAFMAAWYARVPVALDPAAVAPARRWRLMPLAFIGARSPLDRALMAARARPDLSPPRGLHPDHPDGLVVVPEATWTWVLAQLDPDVARRWAAWPTI